MAHGWRRQWQGAAALTRHCRCLWKRGKASSGKEVSKGWAQLCCRPRCGRCTSARAEALRCGRRDLFPKHVTLSHIDVDAGAGSGVLLVPGRIAGSRIA